MLSEGDGEKLELENDIAKLTRDQRQLKVKINQLNNFIDQFYNDNALAVLRNYIQQLYKDLKHAKAFFEQLDEDRYSIKELKIGLAKYPAMRLVIDTKALYHENSKILKDFIKSTKTDLEKAKAELEQKKKELNEKVAERNKTTDNLSEIEKLLETKLEEQKQTGMVTDPAKIGQNESGLEYVQATHRIGIVSATTDDRKNIGLIEPVIGTNKTTYELKTRVLHAPVYDELDEAWLTLQLEPGKIPLENEDFMNKLVVLVPKLDEAFVRNAWHVSQVEYEIGPFDHTSEMTLQQLVYTPFSLLFMAAAGGCNKKEYKVDEFVSASLSVMSTQTDENNFKASKISTKPDAAVTLKEGSDAYGVMEIKASSSEDNDLSFADNDKCVITTAVTAIVARKCIEKEFYGEVAVPFVVASRAYCSLYVTILDKQGFPCIRVVKYPRNSGHARRRNCSVSKSDEWRSLFVALAVLLNKFKTLFDPKTLQRYYDLYENCYATVNRFPSLSFRSERQGNVSHSSTRGNPSKPRDIPPSGRTKEDDAIEAAACGGRFCNVEYPFDRYLRFTDSGVVLDEQPTSPFYFKARPVASANLPTAKKVFLKLWCVEDIDVSCVESEWMCHQTAFKTGVPVAAPILAEVAKSSSTNGSEYLVFAVEYIDQDSIESIESPERFFQFCDSLIDTVMKLHDRAGLLHCDLKPENIRWSNGVVRLIDFGRSQSRNSAIWVRGTEGFEATEILDRLPCSTKTDAFSVGRIILTFLETLENIWRNMASQEKAICDMLRGVGEDLAHCDPEARLTLIDAATLLERYESDNQCSPLRKILKLDTSFVPVTA